MSMTKLAGAKSSTAKVAGEESRTVASANWTFMTNHTHVLLSLYRQPDQRLRDVAVAVGITERMVQRVVAELVEANYLMITKQGRCNRYTVNANLQLRHPLEKHHTIGELLDLLSLDPGDDQA